MVSFASGLSFMKMFGIGTALAVVIDATIIRGVVVPAFLRVAGELNWWAPQPLRWLHSRIGISEALSAAADEAPMSTPLEVPHQSVEREAVERSAVPVPEPADPAREVELIPGRHLVASVNGTVIVVAHRGGRLSNQSLAARQLSKLVDIVRRTDRARLAYAFSQLTQSTSRSSDFVEVGIVMPTPAGLEVFLCGGVTVALDNGSGTTLLKGSGRCVHHSVPEPAVAAVISVDEAGQRPALAPRDRNGVYALTEGTVPGLGAVVWSTHAPSAPVLAPLVPSPARSDRLSTAPTVQLARPKRLIVLDDNSRFEIDRDCVLGRDPHDSDAVERGLRPVRIDDRKGEMSRAHVEIRLVNGDVVIVDRHSTNGVFMRDPAQHGWTRLAPWEPAKWLPGASVLIGGRTLHLHAPTTHRPLQRPHVNVRYDVSKQLHAKAKIA